MLSSRRVNKGPGRRPQSAKRQRFMELRERGLSIRAAVRQVGVARTTGTNLGVRSKTYRNGEVDGFVPPLDRPAVRKVSSMSSSRTSASRSPTRQRSRVNCSATPAAAEVIVPSAPTGERLAVALVDIVAVSRRTASCAG
jgi:hypothetical protein